MEFWICDDLELNWCSYSRPRLILLVKNQGRQGLSRNRAEYFNLDWSFNMAGQYTTLRCNKRIGKNLILLCMIEDIEVELGFQFGIIWTRIGGVIHVWSCIYEGYAETWAKSRCRGILIRTDFFRRLHQYVAIHGIKKQGKFWLTRIW